MTSMTFDAEMLTLSTCPTNLYLLAGSIGEYVSEAMDQEVNRDLDHYHDCTGEDVDPDWVVDTRFDFAGAYKVFAGDLPEILAEAYEDLFTTTDRGGAPVRIGKVSESNHRDPGGWGRETIMAPLTIDGARLKELADLYGITEINDGSGISGFVRTADDDFWSQIRVIGKLMEAMDGTYYENLSHALDEWADTDGWVSHYITYPDEFYEKLCNL